MNVGAAQRDERLVADGIVVLDPIFADVPVTELTTSADDDSPGPAS